MQIYSLENQATDEEWKPDAGQEPIYLNCPALSTGQSIMLTPYLPSAEQNVPPLSALDKSLFYPAGPLGPLSVGTVLRTKEKQLLSILGRFMLPILGAGHTTPCINAVALCDIEEEFLSVFSYKKGFSIAWVTLSDKGFLGQRKDESGPLIEKMLEEYLPLRCSTGYILPDDPAQLRALMEDLASTQGYNLIICTGGTGVGPRDTTPEALLPLFDRRLPGFEQAMMLAAMAQTPNALISRAVAGSIGASLVLTLPGSAKAVKENLNAVIPALAHTLDKLQGDPVDCANLHINSPCQ